MNSKLAKLSDMELEQKLVKLEKNKKLVDKLFMAIIVLSGLLLLLNGFDITSLSSLAIVVVCKFVFIPQNLGIVKNEINKRKSINIVNSN